MGSPNRHRHRPGLSSARRAAALAALLAVTAATSAAAAAAAPAATPAALHAAVGRALRASSAPGEHVGVVVRDLGSGEVLEAREADRPLIPASNEKLVTAAAAVASLGPSYTFGTSLLAEPIAAGGRIDGPLFLRGGGDPTFSTDTFARRYWSGRAARLGSLVTGARRAGIRRATGPLIGDATAFDDLQTGPLWKPTYLWVESPALSALSIDRGEGSDHGRPPALNTARVAAAALARAGVRTAGGVRTGATQAGATTVATVRSPPLSALLVPMLRDSDNFVAEQVMKAIGAQVAGVGATAPGAEAARQHLFEAGVDVDGVQPVDGSGLSRANRVTASAITELLASLQAAPGGRAVLDALPIAGRTGTLRHRLRGTVAAGRLRAKTGTLNGVSALSGIVTAYGGRRLAFSVIHNGPASASAAHDAQDAIAVAVAGYRG